MKYVPFGRGILSRRTAHVEVDGARVSAGSARVLRAPGPLVRTTSRAASRPGSRGVNPQPVQRCWTRWLASVMLARRVLRRP